MNAGGPWGLAGSSVSGLLGKATSSGRSTKVDFPPGRIAFPTSVSVMKVQRYLKLGLSWADDDDDGDNRNY